MTNPRCILLTGGGTAGHVTPNLALLPSLQKRGFVVSYIGSAAGIERELIGREGIPFYSIPAGKLRRYADLRNVTDIARIKLGFLQSLLLVRRIKPSVLFSKGGFVSCPVVWACWFLRVPVIIHESDISPGLANRLSLPFAKKICYSFPETAAHLPRGKAVHTGIPFREALLKGDSAKGRAWCGFTNARPVIMVIGGSLGSQAVNACARESLDKLLEEFNVCHICGKGNLADEHRPGYAQFEYVNEELAHLFATADVVISRAGATALFEIAALRKPSLLVPLPRSASRGDQILNAQSFEKQGFSRVLLQENMTPEALVKNVFDVYENREMMITAMKERAPYSAAGKIMEVIEAEAAITRK
ncbi:MAG: undecaprenyldiphospho-muramoylpentapeptide beta-N-acetylglucosaminyltransferase [Chitinispirillaceae bacterium]|nr:undecaprenyldiphospho-muramoylpentapeptide beta-N-acetylglucosaminyltransferase [Chitinispirillaceae bacterium]